jgi:AsmA-like C-terminal region
MSDEKTAKGSRLKRYLKILLSLIAIMVVCLVLLPTCASTGLGRSWTAARLTSALSRDVTLGDLDAGWTSGITLVDLTIANAPGFSPEPLFTAGRIVVKPGIVDAVGGAINADLLLRDAELRIEKDADGKLNTDGMFPEEEAQEGDAEPKEPDPLTLTLVLENVSLTYIDHGQPEGARETRVEDLDMTLQVQGDDPDDLAGMLTATITKVASGSGLNSENITIEVEGKDGAWTLKEVTAPVNGGTVTASGWMRFGEENRGFDFDLDIDGVQFSRGFPLLSYVIPILEVSPTGTAEGTLKGSLNVHGTAFGMDALKASLGGKGDVRIQSGKVTGNGILAQAMALAGQGGALKFDDLGTSFEITTGRVRAKEIKIGGGSMRMVLDGSVGFDGDLDYQIRLKPKGKQWKKIMKSLGDDGLVPVRITGTLVKPEIHEPDPVKMLKSITEKKIGDLFK